MSVEIVQITKEKFAEWEAGPDGTCKGCNEPNRFCQCEPCDVCFSSHDPNYGCRQGKLV
jgi:hypothetical protein